MSCDMGSLCWWIHSLDIIIITIIMITIIILTITIMIIIIMRRYVTV